MVNSNAHPQLWQLPPLCLYPVIKFLFSKKFCLSGFGIFLINQMFGILSHLNSNIIWDSEINYITSSPVLYFQESSESDKAVDWGTGTNLLHLSWKTQACTFLPLAYYFFSVTLKLDLSSVSSQSHYNWMTNVSLASSTYCCCNSPTIFLLVSLIMFCWVYVMNVLIVRGPGCSRIMNIIVIIIGVTT